MQGFLRLLNSKSKKKALLIILFIFIKLKSIRTVIIGVTYV